MVVASPPKPLNKTTAPVVPARDSLIEQLTEQMKVNNAGQAALTLILEKLDRRLNPARNFYPMRQTIAAGAAWEFTPGVTPTAWFISLDPNSVNGVASVQSTADSAPFIDLYPGAHIIFPARSQSVKVLNSGSGNALVTIAALGDVPFDYSVS